MNDRAGRQAPPASDDIAVQHRPENAQSRHSALHRTEADGHKRGGDRTAGPKPDEDELAADPYRPKPDDGASRFDPAAPAMPAGGLGRQPARQAVPLAADPRIQRIEKLAEWLDTKFTLPIINWPIGLDGIIGLIPGVGDTITAGLSSYLIYEAHNAGARKGTLAKMGWNVAVDWALGAIPLVGDVFDVAHKANTKNARLLLEELRRREAERAGDEP